MASAQLHHDNSGIVVTSRDTGAKGHADHKRQNVCKLASNQVTLERFGGDQRTLQSATRMVRAVVGPDASFDVSDTLSDSRFLVRGIKVIELTQCADLKKGIARALELSPRVRYRDADISLGAGGALAVTADDRDTAKALAGTLAPRHMDLHIRRTADIAFRKDIATVRAWHDVLDIAPVLCEMEPFLPAHVEVFAKCFHVGPIPHYADLEGIDALRTRHRVQWTLRCSSDQAAADAERALRESSLPHQHIAYA